MSGPPPIGPAGPPSTRRAVLIRNQAVASILAYGTIAGGMVEAERYDAVASGDMPRVIVFGHETLQGTSRAGTAPRFKTSCNMEVQCSVERARMPDAVADLDTLVDQVMQALLCDPAWVKLSEFVESGAVLRKFETQDLMAVGDARITLVCNYNETYPPTLTTPLEQVNVTVAPASSDATVVVDITDLNS